MNPILVAQLISAVGTVGLPLVQKLMADVNAGRTVTTVTPEDVGEVHRLSQLSAAAIFKAAGVALPPAQ